MADPKQLTEKITHSLAGSWQSVRSTIPHYRPGSEWLHLAANGGSVWEIEQPSGKGRPSINCVAVKTEGTGHRLYLIKDGAEDYPLAKLRISAVMRFR